MKIHNPENIHPDLLPEGYRFMWEEEVLSRRFDAVNAIEKEDQIMSYIGDYGDGPEWSGGMYGTSPMTTYAVPLEYKIEGLVYQWEGVSS